MAEHTYLCIDLKSFYASVECADRQLDPFTTDLVVADPERSINTICLAITPSMKAKGVHNRCRIRDIPKDMAYITAVPRMHRYMEVSAEIYRTYLSFVCSEDIWPYSIDECFIDATPYLRLYHVDIHTFARQVIATVRTKTGIAATAGIGPNMFLAKVALDICAKHADDGIGILDEESFRREIWFHHPITDIWSIGSGTARRLAQRHIYDLAGICAERPEIIRSMFGKNGEYLLDHAWGLEPATIADCRNYTPQAHSLSNGQVLMRDYTFEEARTVVREMVFGSCMNLAEQLLACDTVGLWIGYSRSLLRSEDARNTAPSMHAGGQHYLGCITASERRISQALMEIFDTQVSPTAPIRRINIALMGVVPAHQAMPTLFDNVEQDEREARLAQAAIRVRRRFGPNALLRGTSLKPGANAYERNLQIGGHRA